MSKTKSITKVGNLTQEFKAAAVLNGDGALAYMLFAAFGTSLSSLMTVADRALVSKDVSVIILALTAGVQIRNHVVFVGADHGGIKQKYPELIIEGARDQPDQFNFGALHALGHLFAHITSDALGRKILAKAGSCISGEFLTDSPAGIINKEINSSWTGGDRVAWTPWNSAKAAEHGTVINQIVASMQQRATDFGKTLAPKARAPPVPVAASIKKAEAT
jgi:hypothetical protein